MLQYIRGIYKELPEHNGVKDLFLWGDGQWESEKAGMVVEPRLEG